MVFTNTTLNLNYKLTILLGSHTGSCCRSSSNTGVSCDVTGVAGVW